MAVVAGRPRDATAAAGWLCKKRIRREHMVFVLHTRLLHTWNAAPVPLSPLY